MGAINTGSFAKALWPGINTWFGQSYKEWKEEYPTLFSIENSTKPYEEEVGVSGFGLANEKSEGAAITYDDARQGFIMRYQHKTYALGFVVSEEMIEDNQYDLTVIGKRDARALAFSMRQTMAPTITSVPGVARRATVATPSASADPANLTGSPIPIAELSVEGT